MISYLLLHIYSQRKNAAFFRPSLLNLYRYDAIQLHSTRFNEYYFPKA